jgi:hypothetical protein
VIEFILIFSTAKSKRYLKRFVRTSFIRIFARLTELLADSIPSKEKEEMPLN